MTVDVFYYLEAGEPSVDWIDFEITLDLGFNRFTLLELRVGKKVQNHSSVGGYAETVT